MKKHFRNSIFRIVVITISVIVVLALTEIILRMIKFEFLMYPSEIQVGYPDPILLKKKYRPDADLLWVSKDYPEKIKNTIDSRPNLALMGCSCTQYGHYDNYFAQHIKRHSPDSSFKCVNVGVGGWSSYLGLQQLKRDILPMKPRMITIYYGWNDHWTSYGMPDKELVKTNLFSTERRIRIYSKIRIAQLFNKIFFAHNIKTDREQLRVSIEDFHDNLSQMIHIARENGIIPVLLTAPSSHKSGSEPEYLGYRFVKNLSDLIPLHRLYVDAVRNVAAETGADMIDLYQLFLDLPEEEWQNYFYWDGIHLTEEGDKLIADFMNEYFVRTGLICKLITCDDMAQSGT